MCENVRDVVMAGPAAAATPDCPAVDEYDLYRGTSLIRKRPSPGPYSSPMPRALWWSWDVGLIFMSEIPV